MSLFADIITNKVIPAAPKYAAIIGAAPSKGARSPLLWNAVFKAEGIVCEMVPFDVPENRIKALVAALKADKNFVGGAVAAPHKILIMAHLDEIEPEAKHIGATNAIYRRGDKLVGANTDGAGALPALRDIAGGSLAGKQALVIGIGGAGRAVAVYLAGEVERLVLSNRNRGAAATLAGAVHSKAKTETCDWPPPKNVLNDIDILINCSSVGFETVKNVTGGQITLKGATPLAPFEPRAVTAAGGDFAAAFSAANKAALDDNIARSREALAALPATAIVFDAVYQPLRTRLIDLAEARGLRTLNGSEMNIEQAVIAFVKAVPGDPKIERVRQLMQERARQA